MQMGGSLVVMALGDGVTKGGDGDIEKWHWKDKQGKSMKSMEVMLKNLFKLRLEANLATGIEGGLLY